MKIYFIPFCTFLLLACRGGKKEEPAASSPPAESVSDNLNLSYKALRKSIPDFKNNQKNKGLLRGKQVENRKIIYTAELKINASRSSKILTNINTSTKQWGGFIDKHSNLANSDQINYKIRIPVGNFEKAVKEFSLMGTLMSKLIYAADITEEYKDIKSHLKIATLMRNRLRAMLKTSRKTIDRIRLLREINRLNQQIENYTILLSSLADQAKYSTIYLTINFQGSVTALKDRSPFLWLRNLNPHYRSITRFSDIDIQAPKAFFSNIKQFKNYRYRSSQSSLFSSPDSIIIRAGTLTNNPRGDLAFWQQALKREMQKRGYKLLGETELNTQLKGVHFNFSFQELNNEVVYSISLFVKEKYLYVIETIYPEKELFDEYQINVMNSIQKATIGS